MRLSVSLGLTDRRSGTSLSPFAVNGVEAQIVFDAASGTYKKDAANTDAAGLFTFARASEATYIDSDGVLQTATSGTIRDAAYLYDAGALVGPFIQVEEGATNLFLNSDTLATQDVTVAAVKHTLHFTGTGTVTLSGASTDGPLVGTGTGEAHRVSLTFTPTAGTLTCTVTGTVTNAQLEVGGVATSYISSGGTQGVRASDNLSIAAENMPSLDGSVSVSMRGRISYDDRDSVAPNVALVGESQFYALYVDNSNYIGAILNTSSSRVGSIEFRQESGGVADNVEQFTAYDPGQNVPFSIAGIHTSGSVGGAVDGGTALARNETPTSLPDLSSVDFIVMPRGYAFIEQLRIFRGDIEDSGAEEVSQRKELYLSSTASGTGDGLSWENAYTDPATAFAAAPEGGTVYSDAPESDPFAPFTATIQSDVRWISDKGANGVTWISGANYSTWADEGSGVFSTALAEERYGLCGCNHGEP